MSEKTASAVLWVLAAVLAGGAAGCRSREGAATAPASRPAATPTIEVRAHLAGADPETMAATVATPLEKELNTISELDSMHSASSMGATRITVRLKAGRDIDAAALDVQAAIARAMRRLPAEMTAPPTYRKVNPDELPVLYVVLTSDSQSPSVLNAMGQVLVQSQLLMLQGAGEVELHGGGRYAVRIELDARRLAAYGLEAAEVAKAVGSQNPGPPGQGLRVGYAPAGTRPAPGPAAGRAGDFSEMIAAVRQGVPVRVKEVGRVFEGVEDEKAAAWYGDRSGTRRAIVLALVRQWGADEAALRAQALQLVPKIRTQLPRDVSLTVVTPGETAADVLCLTRLPAGAGPAEAARLQEALHRVLAAAPDVESVVSMIPARGSDDASVGEVLVRLKPGAAGRSVAAAIDALRVKAGAIPGLAVRLRPAGRPFCRYTLYSPDTETLHQVSGLLARRLKATEGLTDVETDLVMGPPGLNVLIDREKAARLQVTPAEAQEAMAVAYGSRQVSTVYTPDDQYAVMLGMQRDATAGPDALSSLYVRSASGAMVPLSGVARIGPDAPRLVTIHHAGQLPSVTISFGVTGPLTVAAAKERVERIAREFVSGSVTARWESPP